MAPARGTLSADAVPTAVPRALQETDADDRPKASLRSRRYMIAISIAYAALLTVVLSRSWFVSDDLENFGLMRQMGLTQSYLRLNVFGHFAPGHRFLDWFVMRLLAAPVGGAGADPLGDVARHRVGPARDRAPAGSDPVVADAPAPAVRGEPTRARDRDLVGGSCVLGTVHAVRCSCDAGGTPVREPAALDRTRCCTRDACSGASSSTRRARSSRSASSPSCGPSKPEGHALRDLVDVLRRCRVLVVTSVVLLGAFAVVVKSG